MKIDVFLVPSEVNGEELRGRTCVVIDVLRTSSSMLQAFANGCREIIPVESVERALALHSTLFDADVLLCGERNGVKIDGFHSGNSPHEYSRRAVEHKSIIFTSTNGTGALVKTKSSAAAYLCGFQNVDVVAGAVSGGIDALCIICAGQDNHFALEDVVCAGMIIDKIRRTAAQEPLLSDAALTAHKLYDHYAPDLQSMVRQAAHGKALMKIGMENDLDFCVRTNNIPLLLQYIEGKIILNRNNPLQTGRGNGSNQR